MSDDPLTLLIYTSGSTGAPKGAMYPERLVANFWRRSTGHGSGRSTVPSIILSFMPMSHGMGPAILFGTLGSGGTAYFAAKSDLSTLLEDLALVHPTDVEHRAAGLGNAVPGVSKRAGPAICRRCRQSGAGGRGHGRAAPQNCSADGSSRR